MTVEWQLRYASGSDAEKDDSIDKPELDTVEHDLEAVYVRDAINPFANKAEVVLDDPEGTKPDKYPRPTLVELDVRVVGAFDFTKRFAGFVQDHERDRNETTLIVLSHDYWLRKQTVYEDYEGSDEENDDNGTAKRIEDVLQDLIQRTPLIWNDELIQIENNEVIDRRWAGEQLETVLEELVSISGGDELFGATFDREFYFRPPTGEASARTFDSSEYFDLSFERDGKHSANRAIVRYGEEEDQAVVVENDRSAQRALRDEIGADEPVEIVVEKSYPEIETERTARRKARQLLEDRSELLTGTVETWEAFAVLPGQLTTVIGPELAIDREYHVVQIEYMWPDGDPETTITVAQKAIDTTDELVALTDEVQRIDLRGVDPDSPILETLEERSGAVLSATATVTTREFGDDRFTPGLGDKKGVEATGEEGEETLGFGRAKLGLDFARVRQRTTETSRITERALDALRDGWIRDCEDGTAGNSSEVDPIEQIAVGRGASVPSRTDTELENWVDRAEATLLRTGDGSLRIDGTFKFEENIGLDESEPGIREIGVLTDDGTLYARAVIDEIGAPALTPVDVSLEITIDDDPDRRGVVTIRGLETLRELFAGTDPIRPTQMAFGTDDTSENVSDTKLGNEAVSVDPRRCRTRGTGTLDFVGRLSGDEEAKEELEELGRASNDEDEDEKELKELGQVTDDGTALTRITFAPLTFDPILEPESEFAVEANQQLQFQNK